jgi:hypothetical protein
MPRKTITKITCPYCNKNITLDEALTGPIEEKMRKEFEKEYDLEIKRAKTELTKKDKELEKIRKSVDEKIGEAIKSEKEKIEKEARKKASELIQKELKDLKEQIQEKDKRIKEAEEEELKLRKERRALEEEKEKFKIESERKLDEERKKISEEATKKAAEEHELKDKEKVKQIEDLKKQISELKRKAEQGSQKLQGEVLELTLEEALKQNFSNDEIEPISSGVRGADILQKVCSNSGKNCGTILFESKNATKWSNGWISKLKKDQREIKADMGVIVSTVLPENVENFSFCEGILIVHYKSVIPVTILLRNQLSEISRAKAFNIGRNEKLEVLYKYLTGTEFKQKVETVVEAFAKMMEDLQKEKRAMTKIWSKREKQIEQAFYGIAGMYGGMQGILGSSLPEIKSLDMPELLPEPKLKKGK